MRPLAGFGQSVAETPSTRPFGYHPETSADDLAIENRRLRGHVLRLQEDIAILQERLADAYQQIAQLRARLPVAPRMTTPAPGSAKGDARP